MVKNNYLGEKSKSLETRIAELKLRILDLERINSIHKALNASLRSVPVSNDASSACLANAPA